MWKLSLVGGSLFKRLTVRSFQCLANRGDEESFKGNATNRFQRRNKTKRHHAANFVLMMS